MIGMLLKLIETENLSNTYVNEGQHYGRGVGGNGKYTGVGYHFLLQRSFQTQGLNHLLCLLYCRQILWLLSHQGSPNKTTICTRNSTIGHIP